MDPVFLVQRGKRYHFRIRVPSDLVDLLGCREIHRSLRTSDNRQARKMAQAMHSKLEAAYSSLRQQLLMSPDSALQRCAGARLISTWLPSARLVPRSPSAMSEKASLRISELVEKFIADRRGSWTGKTQLMRRAALRVFVEITGDPVPTDITRDTCRRFRDTLARLPPNMRKRFKRQSVGEILDMKLPPMSTANVNKHLAAVSAFLNWCVDERLARDNASRGLRMRTRRHPDTERDVFGYAELSRLFGSPLYAGCASKAHRDTQGPLVFRDAKFWLPLIALYSGMRLEEIAQLAVCHLRQVEDIWVFDLNMADGRNLKTPYCQRLVPIHSALIECGLVQYADGLARQGAIRLWPDLRHGSDGTYSSPFSKWFARYKRKVGITNPRITFHSLRHTFIDNLKQSGTEEAAVKELVGHANDSITTGRYGKRYRLWRLRTVVESVAYRLDLSAFGHRLDFPSEHPPLAMDRMDQTIEERDRSVRKLDSPPSEAFEGLDRRIEHPALIVEPVDQDRVSPRKA